MLAPEQAIPSRRSPRAGWKTTSIRRTQPSWPCPDALATRERCREWGILLHDVGGLRPIDPIGRRSLVSVRRPTDMDLSSAQSAAFVIHQTHPSARLRLPAALPHPEHTDSPADALDASAC